MFLLINKTPFFALYETTPFLAPSFKIKCIVPIFFYDEVFCKMKQYVWTLAAVILIAFCNYSECRSMSKRQIHVDAAVHSDVHNNAIWRDKQKVEAKFGIKNALLGFVFNKINSFIDKKTHWVDQLDKTNIAKNEAQGIYPPKDPVVSLTGIITDTVGQKLQAAGPLIGVVVQKLTSGSGGIFGGGGAGAHATPGITPGHPPAIGGSAGFNIGSILGSLSAAKGFGAGGSAHGGVSGYGR